MVMRELHEAPLGGHFATKINIGKDIGCWILVANYVQKCA
jgi:hypothetical protein